MVSIYLRPLKVDAREMPGHLEALCYWPNARCHGDITQRFGVAIYCCDMHSPKQREANEHINGLIRQDLLKGTDLSAHSQAELDAIAFELNMRPRKRLGYRTPAQVFLGEYSGALNTAGAALIA